MLVTGPSACGLRVLYHFQALLTSFKRIREAKTSAEDTERHVLQYDDRTLFETVKSKLHLKTLSRADSILRLISGIRYVAIIDKSNTIIECKGQGASSLALSPGTFLDFASTGPLLVLASMACKLESSCGRLGYVTGRFENAFVTLFKMPSLMVAVVTDVVLSTQELEKIAAYLRRMEEASTNSYVFDYDVMRYGA
jgi:hypothetical protein